MSHIAGNNDLSPGFHTAFQNTIILFLRPDGADGDFGTDQLQKSLALISSTMSSMSSGLRPFFIALRLPYSRRFRHLLSARYFLNPSRTSLLFVRPSSFSRGCRYDAEF